MTFNDYQTAALRTARNLDPKDALLERLLGLVGETGEIAEKIKKNIRDDNFDISKLDRTDMTKEFGDVLWYLAVLADHLGINLDDIATKNIDKLADRARRGKISGSGDNR